jgi:hypothetical protein
MDRARLRLTQTPRRHPRGIPSPTARIQAINGTFMCCGHSCNPCVLPPALNEIAFEQTSPTTDTINRTSMPMDHIRAGHVPSSHRKSIIDFIPQLIDFGITINLTLEFIPTS